MRIWMGEGVSNVGMIGPLRMVGGSTAVGRQRTQPE
jgi:hypothetical protein